MVAIRSESTEVEVEITIGEHSKGAVRLVAFFAGHESTPKVVLEHLQKGGFASIQVIVGEDASVIVEYEVSVQRAPVAQKGDCKDESGRN